MVLQRTEACFDGKMLLTNLTLAERESILPITMKTEEVYRLLQLTRGIDVVVFIKQEESDKHSVSFRSNGRILVDAIAAKLGGGGHKLAAACAMEGNFSDIRARVMETLKSYFD